MVEKRDIEYVTKMLQHYRYVEKVNNEYLNDSIQYLQAILDEEFQEEY